MIQKMVEVSINKNALVIDDLVNNITIPLRHISMVDYNKKTQTFSIYHGTSHISFYVDDTPEKLDELRTFISDQIAEYE